MLLKSVLFLFAVFSECYGMVDIGQYLKICNRNTVDVNDCLVEAIQDALVSLADGLKELGVPALDPNYEKEIKVEYKRNQMDLFGYASHRQDILCNCPSYTLGYSNVQVYAKMAMRDIYVEGMKAAKVHDARLRADEDRFHLEVDLTTPRVFVHGKYLGEGRFNSLSVNATGMFNTTMTDLVYTWKIDGIPEKKDDDTYIRIKSFYMRPDLGNLVSYLSNDNPDSQAIIQIANDFANSNWRLLYRELLPYAQANWNRIGVRIANKIFLKVPYGKLFPA